MSAAGDTSVRRIEDYDLMDPATQQCPYPYYGLLREEAPVYRMPTTGFHLVTGFEVARKAMLPSFAQAQPAERYRFAA